MFVYISQQQVPKFVGTVLKKSDMSKEETSTSPNWMESYVQKINGRIESNPSLDHYLTLLENNIHLNKSTILVLLVALLALSLVSGTGSQLICTLIGCLYPAYASIKPLGKFFSI